MVHEDQQVDTHGGTDGTASGAGCSARLRPGQESKEVHAAAATGVPGHVSAYYTRRCKRHKGHYKYRYPKLSAVCDTANHLILGTVIDRGPKPDAIWAFAASSRRPYADGRGRTVNPVRSTDTTGDSCRSIFPSRHSANDGRSKLCSACSNGTLARVSVPDITTASRARSAPAS